MLSPVPCLQDCLSGKLIPNILHYKSLEDAMVRPKEIAPPFPKSESIITIHDRVWYLPPLGDTKLFQFPGWHDALVFPTSGDIHIEYCSGNGAWIAEKAKLHPESNWLAVEKRFDRARKIWSKIKNLELDNLLVAFAEGLKLSRNYIPDASVTSIYVNFPDPWPKTRHAKHRIISPEFLTECSRVLKPEGNLIFVTDDEPYSQFFSEVASGQTSLTPHGSGISSPPEDYGTSFFDSLFRSQGKTIFYHHLVKNASFE